MYRLSVVFNLVIKGFKICNFSIDMLYITNPKKQFLIFNYDKKFKYISQQSYSR